MLKLYDYTQIKNKVHDASGIINPEEYKWYKFKGVYYPKKLHSVFVYGTLKRGHHNNRLLKHYEPREAFCKYLKLHQGPGFPYATFGNEGIYGEVYEIDDDTLDRLDLLEGVPHHYNRVKVKVKINNKEVEVWTYISPQNALKYPVIQSGVWS